MRRKIFTAVSSVVILFMASVVMRIYTVRTSAPMATPIWNGEKCYVFVSQKAWGYNDSVLSWLGSIGLQLIYGVPRTSDHRSSLHVFELGPQGVIWHRQFSDVSLGILLINDSSIFARIGDAETRPFRWNGRGFDPINDPEDRRKFDLARPTFAADTQGEWSTLGSILDGEEDRKEYPIKTGGGSITLVVQSVGAYIDKPARLGLKDNNGAVDFFWSLDERPRRVSRAEYKTIFSHGPPQFH